jgi:hypothetical protein
MGRLPAALLGEYRCNGCFGRVNSTSGVAAKDPGAVHLGKIGWEASCWPVSLSNTIVACKLTPILPRLFQWLGLCLSPATPDPWIFRIERGEGCHELLLNAKEVIQINQEQDRRGHPPDVSTGR